MSTRVALAVAAVLALPAVVHAGPFMFGTGVKIMDAFGGQAIVADLNNDGRDDLAVMGQDRYIEVFLQQADGTLPWKTRISFPDRVGSMQAVDLGNDGRMELVVDKQEGFTAYRWNGVNAFAPTDYPYPCGGFHTVDLDADGDLDLVCGINDGLEAMLIYSGPGTTLSEPVYFPTAGGVVRITDLTGDGRPDLLASRGNSFFVHAHDGDRGFLPAVAYTRPSDRHMSYPNLAVVEHGGVKEVVVTGSCNMPCATLYKYRMGPNGYFELAGQQPTLDNPDTLLVRDLDGDGLEDLLVGHGGYFTLGRFMGQAQRLSSAELWTPLIAKYTYNYAVGDLNGDGHLDLVTSDHRVHIHYGGRQVPNDFDGNLNSDLAWRNSNGEFMVWWTAVSTGSLRLDPLGADWRVQASGDFDGDGEAETFWRHRITGENRIRTRYGTELEPTTTIASQEWQVVGDGDFDGDGRNDLLWRNSRTGANTVWRSGKSETYQVLAVIDLGWKMAGVGDFNGDGRSDIVWRNTTTGANLLWPSGRKELQQALSTVASQQWSVVGVGDINGDNKDDLVWRNSTTGANDLWPSANLAARIPLGAAPLAWSIAAVGHYDKDGRADLMWRNASTGQNVMWQNADSKRLRAVSALVGWEVVP